MSDLVGSIGIVGKLSSGSGSKGYDELGDIADSKLSCPAVIDNHDLPKVILGVTPPLQDGFVIKGDFATCFMKKYLAACVAQMAMERRLLMRPGS